MRDYGKVAATFWTRGTGKSLRGNQAAQIVAMYLMTCSHANMIGVFPLPKLYIAHETGLSLEDAANGLAKCVEVGFCMYDEESETIFVVEMAAYQIGETLKSGDLRAKSIYKQYRGISQAEIKQAFFDRYGDDYDLPEAPCKPLASPLEGALKSPEGASKPLVIDTATATATELPSIPLNDGTDFQVPPDLFAELCAAYSNIDVPAELRKARAWCVSNPAERKTRRGAGKFLNSWMSRAKPAPVAEIGRASLPGGGRRAL